MASSTWCHVMSGGESLVLVSMVPIDEEAGDHVDSFPAGYLILGLRLAR